MFASLSSERTLKGFRYQSRFERASLPPGGLHLDTAVLVHTAFHLSVFPRANLEPNHYGKTGKSRTSKDQKATSL